MGDTREQLASLFAEFFAAGTPRQSYDYAEQAQAIAHRALVEECAAGAVRGHMPEDGCSVDHWCILSDKCSPCLRPDLPEPIPIAHAPKRLAEEVAEKLTEGGPWRIDERVIVHQEEGDSRATVVEDTGAPTKKQPGTWVDIQKYGQLTEGIPSYLIERLDLPPFAAAITVAGGVTVWTLVSGACGKCEGSKLAGVEPDTIPCPACTGTGARTDCLKLARRYDPEATGDARRASFKVTS